MCSELEPTKCVAMLTVQQTCLDCDERFRFLDEECVAQFYLPSFADRILRHNGVIPKSINASAQWQQAYASEEAQDLSFSLLQVEGDGATFLNMPKIDPQNGDLSFCLVPGYFGVNVFDVTLHDDGYHSQPSAASSGPLSFGPFQLVIIVSLFCILLRCPPRLFLAHGVSRRTR